MKIALLSYNDTLGGAAIASYRLMRALRDLGHDARMVVCHKFSNDPNVILAGNALSRRGAFLAERAGIFINNGYNRADLFKVSTASFGVKVLDNEFVRSADAIQIGWINQGLLSLKELQRLCATGKPIVWTMHDMWCMTGICHHSFGCENYTNRCGNCRFLGNEASGSDLSSSVWQKKEKLYAAAPSLKFVAVSSWVKKRAEESSLLGERETIVIGNPFPIDDFTVSDKGTKNQKVILFGAARLDDGVKRLDLAIDALNILADRHPELTGAAVVRFYGACRDNSLFERLRFPYDLLGTIDASRLPDLYREADIVLSTSEFETLGGTLVEGMASGAVPVTYGEGGQSDFISHLKNGYIARYLSAADTADGIIWAMNAGINPEDQHHDIAAIYSPQTIARKYLKLFDQLN